MLALVLFLGGKSAEGEVVEVEMSWKLSSCTCKNCGKRRRDSRERLRLNLIVNWGSTCGGDKIALLCWTQRQQGVPLFQSSTIKGGAID